MGSALSCQNIHFEELSEMINNNSTEITIINTLPELEQSCLIKNTISATIEVDTINKLLKIAEEDFPILEVINERFFPSRLASLE